MTNTKLDPTHAPYLEHLEHEQFETPVSFRVSYIGEQTIMPAYEIETNILEGIHNLEYEVDYDLIGGGLEQDEKQWWGYVFGAEHVENPQQVIQNVATLLTNFNEPPDDLPEEGKEEWLASTVVITDLLGIDTTEFELEKGVFHFSQSENNE